MARWFYGVMGLAVIAAPMQQVQAHDVSNQQIICRYLEEVSRDVRHHIRVDRELTPFHQIHLAVLLKHRQAGCGQDHADELDRLMDAVDKQLEVTVK